ncbi:MAG TPA: tetratricopeptide repeat protein [Polyangium sp.]|nr:tetratricopeptide repeat protein [Polyangium sp.]
MKSISFAVALAFISSTAIAEAGSGEDKAAADALFKAGRALVRQGKFSEGCPKLEASHKLDPATGTLLALGDCYESNGQTASAWTTFNEARAMARKANDSKRADEAERRAGLLEGKLSKVVIEVPQDTRDSSVEVRRNGKLVDPAMYGVEVAIDPGKQTIDATAPGQQVWTTEVLVEPASGVTTIRIPSLVDMKPVEKPRPPPPPPPPPPAPLENKESSGGGTQKAIGVVVASVGAVGIAVGSIFGARAISLVNDVKGQCKGDPPRCATGESVDTYNSANTSATISNVGIGVGAAAVVAGIVVIVAAPKITVPKTSAWTIAPVITPQWTALSVTGVF